MLQSVAVVPIDRPQRWAKQLADHFAHKTQVDDVDGGRLIHFSVGDGLVGTSDTAVLLTAYGENAEQLAAVQDVLARHLERFAQREAVTASWGEVTA